MKKLLLFVIACAIVPGLAAADVISIPDALDQTGTYGVANDFEGDLEISGTYYLVGTMTVTNTGAYAYSYNTPAIGGVQFGQAWNSANWAIVGGGKTVSDVPIPEATPTLLVLKVNTTQGTSDLFINPDLDGLEPTDPADPNHITRAVGGVATGVGFAGDATSGTNDLVVDYEGFEVYYNGETPFGMSVTQQPQDALAFSDEPVSFSVEVASSSTVSYQWKIDDGDGDTSNDLDVEGATDATLSFATAAGNWGTYYCEVTSDGGFTLLSDSATLAIKEEVCHWAFEGDLTDGTGNGYDGTAYYEADTVIDPNYVTGIDGQALDADTILVEHDLSEQQSWQEFTVNLWVKSDTDTQTSYAGIFNNGKAAGDDFQIGCGTTVYRFNGSVAVNDMAPLSTTEWTMLTVTCDAAGTKVYADGSYVGENGSRRVDFGRFAVGANRGDGLFFDGAIDDLRIFNYAKTAEEVATDYYAITGEAVCTDRPAWDVAGPNGEPDCVVDLLDLASFATEWMDCGLTPAEACSL
ncbi:hypothetical protein STSP2_01222 [Anaerohalosphaera lusitana]|uniref:Ig-like domain-containing protein n=2 Tax=Anaerohalosphaera lusitana TaxID=1936003 RepID=A0A1U9NJS7_9BACT|nr:hypothetical protein STSP2_01222 [Anaerohalosphaera lusitana]